VPPAYSAIKIDGKRAYHMARKGQQPELKAKILVIDEIQLLEYAQTQIVVRVVCSKGTYIRALARDIGQALNSGAHLTALRRTRVGNVTADMCMSVDQMAEMIRTTPIEMPEEQN
jgi:tRNA pseudouridine55 synthase